jgi:hypothetical protein
MDPFVTQKEPEKKSSVFKPPKPKTEEGGAFSTRTSGGNRNEMNMHARKTTIDSRPKT